MLRKRGTSATARWRVNRRTTSECSEWCKTSVAVSRKSPGFPSLESTVQEYKAGSLHNRPLTTESPREFRLTVNNPDVCACKSTLAQVTRVGGLVGGLVANERLLVSGQLAGQHGSTKTLLKKRNSDFAKSTFEYEVWLRC